MVRFALLVEKSAKAIMHVGVHGSCDAPQAPFHPPTSPPTPAGLPSHSTPPPALPRRRKRTPRCAAALARGCARRAGGGHAARCHGGRVHRRDRARAGPQPARCSSAGVLIPWIRCQCAVQPCNCWQGSLEPRTVRDAPWNAWRQQLQGERCSGCFSESPRLRSPACPVPLGKHVKWEQATAVETGPPVGKLWRHTLSAALTTSPQTAMLVCCSAVSRSLAR